RLQEPKTSWQPITTQSPRDIVSFLMETACSWHDGLPQIFCRLEKDGSHVRQTRCIFARHYGLYLSRISRHAAATPDVDAQRHSYGSGVCFCKYAEQAAEGFQAAVSCGCV